MLSHASTEPLTGDLDTLRVLHQVLRFVPYNRRTLCAVRCVSKPYRRAVQHPQGPWAGHEEIMMSKYGHCVIFNAKDDEEGRSNFGLSSVSPIGRKFTTLGVKMLSRHHQCVADGLTSLVLHHSQIDLDVFDALAPLTNLRKLELALCRKITSVAGASRVASLESLEVDLCPLVADGVVGLLLPKLKRLKLRSCSKLSNLNGIAPATAAALEELYVENCDVYDDTVNRFFTNFTTNLKILHLPGAHIDTALTRVSAEVREKSLVSLHLRDTLLRFVTLRALAPSMQNRLEFLSLDGCARLESFEPLCRLQGLRFLDITSATHGEGLQFLTCCAKLELFRMAHAKIKDISFVSSLQALRVLDATNSPLDDLSLVFLENLPMLEVVVLTTCTDIKDINVLSTCKRIRRIFCANTAVTNEGITSLTACPELEELDLRTTAVTDVNFLVGCPSLKCVSVYGAALGSEGYQDLLQSNIEVICDPVGEGGSFDDA
ncbi:Leucine-rich, ribonuclease inhibitor subtype [Trypanosoma conorhini]|uniref:Leucine-rich, ribonuclease inhibitor subtype n=1 Tax=Trypanosoma conorhini TaxID=83891 RepID=A0A422PXY7_9TRYP|nr:Leucine-rich, ribonuclease inhibitor subtype [Trypanosoma conorhini]RNF22347.1 Leucine-rich, ribonuclease inhibitor subtype [Trypanosoma conorhini]